jgi:phosphatidylglycerol---prolipoprotein diacylglyceryl transferase
MYVHNLNPVLINLFGLQIRWYGLMYVLGILIVYFFLNYHRKEIKMSKDDVSNFSFYLAVFMLLGGRLGYVIFYGLMNYLRNPLDILKVWQGGMSFHGSFLMATLFVYFYSKKHKINFLKFADYVILPIPITLMLGRIGNFINGELIGRVCNCSYGIVYPPESISRYPSQLFEALKNLFLFSVLFAGFKKLKEGSIFFGFILGYGILRIIVEFFRVPEIVFFNVTMGQLLSIPMIIVGALGLVLIHVRRFHK